MDQETLVKAGHTLVEAMDNSGFRPRTAMWVHNLDTDTWKLWLVPPVGFKDKADFYRRIAGLVTKLRAEMCGIDTSDTEMVADTHPAMKGLASIMRAPNLGVHYFSGNKFDNFYLPDGIILRVDL